MNAPLQKKRMHGALKFFLMALAGGLLAMICTPRVGGAAMPTSSDWTLKQQYELAINSFIGASLAFMILSGIAMILKRWGLAGFLFGVAAMMAIATLATLAMRMFDVPYYKR